MYSISFPNIRRPHQTDKIPLEILAQGEEGRQAYQEALRDGGMNVYKLRIMLVGQDHVGKTSLRRSLLGQK